MVLQTHMAPKSVVFLVFVTSGCFAWQNLPSIPAGGRAEYFLLQGDGGYKYGYDTGEGQSHLATADAANQVTGKYSFVNKDGELVNVDYRAGYEGFVPQSQSPGYSSASSSSGYSSSSGASSVGSGQRILSQGNTATSSNAYALGGLSSSTFVDPDYEENSDASYNFAFDTPEYKRQESSDSQGNVRGQYSYVGKEGTRHALSYVAGSGTGFVAVTDGNQAGSGLSSSGYSAGGYSQGSSATRSGGYSQGAGYTSSSSSSGRTPYSGPLADINSNVNPDGSYTFSYQAGDHSRQEVSDTQGNVQGTYTFVAKDGVQRSLSYSAGAEQGFVAQGDHLPKPQPVPASHSSSLGLSRIGGSFAQSGSLIRTPASTSLLSDSGDGSSGGPVDASYSFQYATNEHSRQESADPTGNVQGQFSFVADDGVQRRVQYQAGAERGFIAQGAHLPKPGSTASQSLSKTGYVKSTSSGLSKSQGTGSADGSYSLNYNVGGGSSAVSSGSQYSQSSGYTKSHIQQQPHELLQTSKSGSVLSHSSGSSHHHSEEPWDASYAFAFQSPEHSRQEKSDPEGNVQGTFTFIGDDGVQRSVNYIAGAEKGFIAQGDHIPQLGGSLQSSSLNVARSGKTVHGSVQSVSSGGVAQSLHSSGRSSYHSSGSDQEESGDPSYAYSYDAGTHSKSESSDSAGNVVGRYSYVGGDGISRTLTYHAGGSKGFVASGAHLPQPPVAGDVYSSSRALLKPPSLPASSAGLSKGLTSFSSSSIQSSATNIPLDNFVIHRFLPPESPHKFGYIFQEKN